MKTIDFEWRQRIFMGIVALAILTVAVAIWDLGYNNAVYQVPLVVTLAVLFLASMALIAYNETTYRQMPVLGAPERLRVTAEEPDSESVAIPIEGQTWNPFEEGDPHLITVSPSMAWTHQDNVAVETRILCNACGHYFAEDLQTGRPARLSCPECKTLIGLKGAKRFEPHVTLRCRACHEPNQVPSVPALTSYLCVTCKTSIRVRGIGSIQEPVARSPIEAEARP
jgi:DNA-directed RNA polymerase subunit RPC12/RpoP